MQQYLKVHSNQQLRQKLYEIIGQTFDDSIGDSFDSSVVYESLSIFDVVYEVPK